MLGPSSPNAVVASFIAGSKCVEFFSVYYYAVCHKTFSPSQHSDSDLVCIDINGPASLGFSA